MKIQILAHTAFTCTICVHISITTHVFFMQGCAEICLYIHTIIYHKASNVRKTAICTKYHNHICAKHQSTNQTLNPSVSPAFGNRLSYKYICPILRIIALPKLFVATSAIEW